MMEIRRSKPAQEGVDPAGILAFLDEIEEKQIHLHSFMLLRNDAVIAEGSYAPCRQEDIHTLFSLSKSFTSTGIGFLVQEGQIHLEDPALKFFPEISKEKVCDRLQKITVKHLLTMNTGQTSEPEGIFGDPARDWIQEFWMNEAKEEPGTWFFYNTLASYMLSAIFTRVSGETLFDYLKVHLFTPLGFSKDIWWEKGAGGYNAGGFGLNISVEDIARFALLLEHQGNLDGMQILSKSWWQDAVYPWSDPSNTWEGENRYGYGYQFWGCHVPGSFRGDGAFGQYCIVLPKEKLLFVSTAGHENMQQIADALWHNILPALEKSPDTFQPKAQTELEQRLLQLQLPTYYEEKESFSSQRDCQTQLPKEWCQKNYRLDTNILGITELSFENTQKGVRIHLTHGTCQNTFEVEPEVWREGTLTLDKKYLEENQFVFGTRLYEKMAARGCLNDGVYYLDFIYPQTAYQDTWELRKTDQGIRLWIKRNTGFDRVDFEVEAVEMKRKMQNS